jgi:AcrR family transcriptional regulator
MPNQRKAPYSLSEKREMTRAQNMEKIEAAAWKVFSTLGLDGATVRDIVTESEVSAGSFYNYYRTKEAVFDKLVAQLMERIRLEIAAGQSGRAGYRDDVAPGLWHLYEHAAFGAGRRGIL